MVAKKRTEQSAAEPQPKEHGQPVRESRPAREQHADKLSVLRENIWKQDRRRAGFSLLNLENAVQPRMGTDGHGYQALAGGKRLTRMVNEARNPKSVFIRVNPWLMISLSDSNCGI